MLIWSPWIIAETHRILTSRWIDRHFQRGGKWDTAAKRQLSRDAHRWLMRIAPAFHVIEDRPPLEPLWTTPPPDEYDWPVWTAAVRSQAHCVVTDNLKDEPPADARGVRQWQGIAYVSPADFQIILDVWSDILEAGSDRPVWSIAEFWDRLHARAAAEQISLPSHLETIVAEMEQRFRRGQSQATGC